MYYQMIKQGYMFNFSYDYNATIEIVTGKSFL